MSLMLKKKKTLMGILEENFLVEHLEFKGI